MRIARVVPDVSGLDKQFDYLVPEAMEPRLRVGSMVRVPLAGRRVGGWVVALGDTDDRTSDDAIAAMLKPIAKITGWGPSSEIVELAAWTAHRWSGRWRAVLTAASPPVAVTAVGSGRYRRRIDASSGACDPVVLNPPVFDPPVFDLAVFELAKLRLAGGGGLLRAAPAADHVDVALAALHSGPTLIVTPTVEMARHLGGRLRTLGFVPALAGRDWALAAAGVDVVIGARSAVLASTVGLRSIVVLDEHDELLQEERNPTWHARDVAIERAQRLGIPCLLVSPSPSLAALAWAEDRICEPSRVDERAGWPIIEPVDLSAEEPWVTSLVSPRLIAALRDDAKRVVCVLNTTGRARRLACRTCRQLTVCEHCGSAVIQAADGALVCPLCATRRPVVCQHCGASGLALLRKGVSRLREELQAAANRPVEEITGTTAGVAADPTINVFVGTEAVLHRLDHADVVAFLDFDAELFAPRYRAAEQVVALTILAARLLGRRADGGRMLLQTREPGHPVIDALVKADTGLLVETELATRRLLRFPPVTAIATLAGVGSDEYAEILRPDERLTISGPADGRFLVRAGHPDDLADALADHPRPSKSKIRIAVDPPRL